MDKDFKEANTGEWPMNLTPRETAVAEHFFQAGQRSLEADISTLHIVKNELGRRVRELEEENVKLKKMISGDIEIKKLEYENGDSDVIKFQSDRYAFYANSNVAVSAARYNNYRCSIGFFGSVNG